MCLCHHRVTFSLLTSSTFTDVRCTLKTKILQIVNKAGINKISLLYLNKLKQTLGQAGHSCSSPKEDGGIVNDAFQKPKLSKAFSDKNSVSILHLQTGSIV